MEEPLFPIKPPATESPTVVFTIEPYRHEGAWVFDDARVGLSREPFVAGITEMIDRLVEHRSGAAQGFRLLFALFPFEGWQASLSWVRADPVEGHWYRADETGDEGWLCPAMFWYFQTPPGRIYVRAEPKNELQSSCPIVKGIRVLLRILVYLWASPVTAPGLCLALLAVISGGHVQFRAGVVETWGGLVGWLLRGNRFWRGGHGPGACNPGPGPGVH